MEGNCLWRLNIRIIKCKNPNIQLGNKPIIDVLSAARAIFLQFSAVSKKMFTFLTKHVLLQLEDI